MWDIIYTYNFFRNHVPLKRIQKTSTFRRFCCEKISVKNAKIVKENIHASVPAKSVFLFNLKI